MLVCCRLLFGGPVPHFFYESLESTFPENSSKMVFLKFGIERLLFTPFYQFLSLYVLSRFEVSIYVYKIIN